MNLVKLFLINFVSLTIFFSNVYANDNIAFINIDKIIKNSNYGKNILNEIQAANNKNIKKLTAMEKELSLDENELNKKKNIISETDFEKEVEKLKKKIFDFRQIKDEITTSFEDRKNKNLNNFFLKINPIIQEYMDEQSIDILLRQENIFIGKNTADITDIIIEKINIKLN